MKKISDEQLRAYFLGGLSGAQAESFEMECAADAKLTERAQAFEGELADEYLRGDLSAADAGLFEANYLTTEARRAKLRVTQGLRQIARAEEAKKAAAASAAPAAATNSIWQTLFGSQSVRFAGGLMLLLVGGALVFYFSNTGADRQQLAEVKVAPPIADLPPTAIQNTLPDVQTPSAETAEKTDVSNREVNRNLISPTKNQPAQKNVPAPKKGSRNQVGLAVFALLPGTLRDAGEQFITVAPSTTNLGLRLKLPEDAGQYQLYRAVVKTAEGDSILTAPSLKSLYLTMPAKKLENRTYIIFLEGKNAAGEFESITDYSFRVRR